MATTTVLLVDDHAVVREGYRRLLEDDGRIAVVGEASDAESAIEQTFKLLPGVIVMDISLPGISGIEATRRIRERQAAAKVLVFSMHEEIIFARRALAAGAMGYITKASAPRVLIEAVLAIAGGAPYLSHDIAQKLALAPTASGSPASESLSVREFEVLKLLAQGHSLADIARRLQLSTKTVANHQTVIKQKLGAETGRELVRHAMRLGIDAAD